MNDELKREAALAALEEVRDGFIVGLGTGSTAAHFIRELGHRVRGGLRVIGIPTSEASAEMAREFGIPLTNFRDHPVIDLTVDGADEVSPELDLIKGLGGALVREKVVAHASKKVIIIVDQSKLVQRLGWRTPIPVEVIPFAIDAVAHRLTAMGGESRVREKAGRTFVSDNGNFVIDWNCGEVHEPAALEKRIKNITGVVDSGLFCQVAELVVVASAGGVQKMRRP